MKTVLVTGVSRGIGKALSSKFLEAGYFVIGTSTSGKSSLTNQNLIVLPLELSQSKSIEDCVNKTLALDKKIDILVNNAGTWVSTDVGPEIDIGSLRKTLDVNLLGPIDFTQRLISAINPRAHIVNISSRMGSMDYTHNAMNPGYKVSKAGLNMFTRILASRFVDSLTVSSVHPGSVQTDMGLPGAPMTPEEAAKYIYELAISKPQTGQFWFKGQPFPW